MLHFEKIVKCNRSSAHGCECKHSLRANGGLSSANVGRLASVVRERLHITSVSFFYVGLTLNSPQILIYSAHKKMVSGLNELFFYVGLT